MQGTLLFVHSLKLFWNQTRAMLFWWKETVQFIMGDKESVGHENDVPPKSWYTCVCVYKHTCLYVCVYSMCIDMHTYAHPWVTLLDLIWNTRLPWQGYFLVLLLKLMSTTYKLYTISVMKYIPMTISRSSPSFARNNCVVFLGQH